MSLFYKKVVDSMTETGDLEWPWLVVSLWVGLKLLQGGEMGQGLLKNTRTFLWIKVQQFTTRKIQNRRGYLCDGKKNYFNQYPDEVPLFLNLPTLIDIVIAVVYFSLSFNIG